MTNEAEDLLDIASGAAPAAALPAEPEALRAAEGLCEKILSRESDDAARTALEDLVARHPDALSGWVALGRVARTQGRTIAAYAYYRVAYHRGLDKARASGWRGDGRIPWEIPANRPFLSALEGLAHCAEAIGEKTEAKRCREFLGMLDPHHPF